MAEQTVRGRFAPSPTGRMHLGNVWTAMHAWVSVRKKKGVMVLRMENLDPERSRREYELQLIEDLKWLGMDWDEGPDCGGPSGPYDQNSRREVYQSYMERLRKAGMIYPCFCTRAELRAASAPHRGEGEVPYRGKCFGLHGEALKHMAGNRQPSWRIRVPEVTIRFRDQIAGEQQSFLPDDCGDFVLQRADGVHAYQLAVTLDDGLMGITEVTRGADLLESTPRQIFLLKTMGFRIPEYRHVPLMTGPDGHRLSKRHRDMDLGWLKSQGWRAERILGMLAFRSGWINRPEDISAQELLTLTAQPPGTADVCIASEDFDTREAAGRQRKRGIHE